MLRAARVSAGPLRSGTVWYAVGPKTAVAPIVVHGGAHARMHPRACTHKAAKACLLARTPTSPIHPGNGQGKRLFRIISCKLGLFCKWRTRNDNKSTTDVKKGIDVIAHVLSPSSGEL